MSRAVVFAGPSISHAEATRDVDVECLPPIERGDIDALLDRGEWPRAIGIVDGKFLHSLSISPKEVLRASDRGIPVYGSSSMGALRAVECAPYGVVGVGRIFEAYNSGWTDQEDEVAVTFDPESLAASSQPLISWRLALRDAVDEGHLEEATADVFLAQAKKTYFPQRTVRLVLHTLGEQMSVGHKDAVAAVLRRPEADIKRLDAELLLRRMQQDLSRTGEVAPKGVSYRALSTR